MIHSQVSMLNTVLLIPVDKNFDSLSFTKRAVHDLIIECKVGVFLVDGEIYQ